MDVAVGSVNGATRLTCSRQSAGVVSETRKTVRFDQLYVRRRPRVPSPVRRTRRLPRGWGQVGVRRQRETPLIGVAPRVAGIR